MPHFWSKPIFWVGFHFVGVILTVVIYRLPAVKEKILRTPKGVQRIFVTTSYLLPPLILPLLSQPRLPWPISARIGAPLTLLIAASSRPIPVLRRQQ